jgi:hypothetical protein
MQRTDRYHFRYTPVRRRFQAGRHFAKVPQMTHNTADIAAYSIELTERTPVKDLTIGFFESTVEHRFPDSGAR